MNTSHRRRRVAAVVATLQPPLTLRAWGEEGFPAVQRLSAAEGWPTPTARPQAALTAWQHSWPALVAIHGETVIGFSRAVGDGSVTTCIAELLVTADWRRR